MAEATTWPQKNWIGDKTRWPWRKYCHRQKFHKTINDLYFFYLNNNWIIIMWQTKAFFYSFRLHFSDFFHYLLYFLSFSLHLIFPALFNHKFIIPHAVYSASHPSPRHVICIPILFSLFTPQLSFPRYILFLFSFLCSLRLVTHSLWTLHRISFASFLLILFSYGIYSFFFLL